jgi:hypothetical protein
LDHVPPLCLKEAEEHVAQQVVEHQVAYLQHQQQVAFLLHLPLRPQVLLDPQLVLAVSLPVPVVLLVMPQLVLHEALPLLLLLAVPAVAALPCHLIVLPFSGRPQEMPAAAAHEV